MALLGFVGYSVWIIAKPVPMEIQGEVEAKQIRIASKLIGRVDSLPIYKGMEVEKGKLLFTIESPEVQAKLKQAQAMREAAQATNSKAETGARTEDIQAAYTQWKKAEAAAGFAQKTFSRISNLYKEGVVSEQKRDEVETKLKAAKENEKAAHLLYKKAKNGARKEDIAASEAMVSRAEGVLEEVNAYIEESALYSPINGEVANIIAEEGELVPAGYPVVSLVDLNDSWVTFNLKETLLKDIKKGTLVKATVPALGPDEIAFKVSYIHSLGNYATWNATKTSGDFDMKTFEVQARPVKPIKGLRPGMSVLVNWDQF
jgi:HlyD family secretion protein